MSKNQTYTKKEEIIDYWIGKIEETELNFDWCDASSVCWNCGCKRKTQRCHIVPFSLKGEDEPSNFVLLCNVCHLNAPNCSNSKTMWDWIRSNKTMYGFTDCYFIEKGLEEYKRMYGEDVLNAMISLGINENNIKEMIEEYNKENVISTHFGDSHFNPVSTAGYVQGLLDYAKQKDLKRENDFIGKHCKEYESKLRKFEMFFNKKK